MKPIVFLDLETTGTNTSNDRIVELAAVKAEQTLLKIISEKQTRINPMVSIPESATAVHQITNEMVKDSPTFAQISKSLFDFLKDCDIAGHNILGFDVHLLSAEFDRCGILWPLPDTYFVDTLIIFREKEKRDLASAVRFYTGQEHEGAHGAVADCKGSLAVLRGQMEMYTDLSAMDVQGLHGFVMGNKVDLAGKLVKNEQGQIVYGFGKDMGKEVRAYPGFADWMLRQDFPTETKRIIRQIIHGNKA